MGYIKIWVLLVWTTKNRVRDYIVNQEEHHRRKSFQEEYDEFMTRYKFDKFVSG
jgi:hypothetical protein